VHRLGLFLGALIMNCCDYKCDQGRDCPARHARQSAEPEGDPVSFHNEAVQTLLIAVTLTAITAVLGVLGGVISWLMTR
jgi:hypothetical protein